MHIVFLFNFMKWAGFNTNRPHHWVVVPHRHVLHLIANLFLWLSKWSDTFLIIADIAEINILQGRSFVGRLFCGVEQRSVYLLNCVLSYFNTLPFASWFFRLDKATGNLILGEVLSGLARSYLFYCLVILLANRLVFFILLGCNSRFLLVCILLMISFGYGRDSFKGVFTLATDLGCLWCLCMTLIHDLDLDCIISRLGRSNTGWIFD